MLGAYLDDNNSSDNSWIYNILIEAANQLKQNNPFLKNYFHLLDFPSSQTANPFPNTFHLSDNNSVSPYLPNDIIIPNVNFNVEIHNEDYYYFHLMIGFVRILHYLQL